MRSLDYIVVAGLAALVIATPPAIGSVEPWAFRPLEAVILALVLVWVAKIWLSAANDQAVVAGVSPQVLLRFAVPVSILLGLVLFQLAPLPPALVRMLSPATYQVYENALPGWPKTTPYSSRAVIPHSKSLSVVASRPAILPTPGAVKRGEGVPFSGVGKDNSQPAEASNSRAEEHSDRLASTWYPLALAPSLTRVALLKFVAYAALFFLVLAYPFVDGEEGERRFIRMLVGAVLVSGLLVAVLGLVQRVSWNGKILWFFVPKDWGVPRPGILPRASGPFVDPDDFANYLAMAFPLALAGVFYGMPSLHKDKQHAFRLLCAGAVVIISSAILLSLSRAGWIDTAIAGVGFGFLCLYGRSRADGEARDGNAERRGARKRSGPRLAAMGKWKWLAGAFAAGASIILLAAFLLVGGQGRTQTAVRTQATIQYGGLGVRPWIWEDSLEMVRDFPVFGVGLAGWPEVFAHFKTVPWSPYAFREAHNDYLQFLTETGLIGFVALIWFFACAAAKLLEARNSFSPTEFPWFVAVCMALVATSFHETVDFCLHIPANAFLFTLLLAVAVRMAVRNTGGSVATRVSGIRARLAAGLTAAGGVVLMVLALAQNGFAYPYDIPRPTSIAQGQAILMAHPASARSHIALVGVAGRDIAPKARLSLIRSAVWLDPTNPHVRDLYVTDLARMGMTKEALRQVTASVYRSPTLGTHFYLRPRLIPWLSAPERAAVTRGFDEAIAARHSGAVYGLAGFDDVLGRFKDEARVYAAAAARAHTPRQQAELFLAAGGAAVKAGDNRLAQTFFRRSIKTRPDDSAPYEDLVRLVYGRSGNLAAAQSAVAEGLGNGADPVGLYLALSSVARANNDKALATKTMLKALAYQPTFSMTMRAGRLYLGLHEYDRAVSMLRKAIGIKPDSAQAFAMLGAAEEANYQYAQADSAYARAAALAPQRYREVYLQFRKRMDQSKG